MLRFYGPDGKELDTVTIQFDREGAEFLVSDMLENDMGVPYEMVGEPVRTIQIATSSPNDSERSAEPS